MRRLDLSFFSFMINSLALRIIYLLETCKTGYYIMNTLCTCVHYWKQQLSASLWRAYHLFNSAIWGYLISTASIIEVYHFNFIFKKYFHGIKCDLYVHILIRSWSSYVSNFNNHPLHTSLSHTIMDVYNYVLDYLGNRKVVF